MKQISPKTFINLSWVCYALGFLLTFFGKDGSFLGLTGIIFSCTAVICERIDRK